MVFPDLPFIRQRRTAHFWLNTRQRQAQAGI